MFLRRGNIFRIMSFVDLHTHSIYSDGSKTPLELIRKAEKLGLTAIALTDHDTIEGLSDFLNVRTTVKLIPGIEISVYDPKYSAEDIHIVGLFIKKENKNLNKIIVLSHKARITQKESMISRLNELGFKISLKQVLDLSSEEIGRPHIAQVLLNNHPELVSTRNIIDSLLVPGKPGYCKREVLFSIYEAISAIKSSGGIAVLAHPFDYSGDPEELIKHFVESGGKAIEVLYPYNKKRIHKGINEDQLHKLFKRLNELRLKYNLLESGGSDYHNDTELELGCMNVPEELFLKLIQCNDGKS
jgi:predicted metal-dependent phosphoesterase TrpH